MDVGPQTPILDIENLAVPCSHCREFVRREAGGVLHTSSGSPNVGRDKRSVSPNVGGPNVGRDKHSGGPNGGGPNVGRDKRSGPPHLHSDGLCGTPLRQLR